MSFSMSCEGYANAHTLLVDAIVESFGAFGGCEKDVWELIDGAGCGEPFRCRCASVSRLDILEVLERYKY